MNAGTTTIRRAVLRARGKLSEPRIATSRRAPGKRLIGWVHSFELVRVTVTAAQFNGLISAKPTAWFKWTGNGWSQEGLGQLDFTTKPNTWYTAWEDVWFFHDGAWLDHL